MRRRVFSGHLYVILMIRSLRGVNVGANWAVAAAENNTFLQLRVNKHILIFPFKHLQLSSHRKEKNTHP